MLMHHLSGQLPALFIVQLDDNLLAWVKLPKRLGSVMRIVCVLLALFGQNISGTH